ncbi:hypothetical protein LLE49_25440 [Alicyclobacillus tolerans]|uniref:hypothetical protein n=1 Tax=Alicyclobacillus tolerans TaxID=90970 RepID=UPI001F3D59F8|nr:hypothetical protein [Alicyclobacillus tolerans]MCF8568073.1 hypothetical protein [Alicyclobacillus tolerans]
MASFICFGVINTNTPQQNGGVFIGEINCGGWDANQKQNLGHGALYGFYNIILNQQSYLLDSFEMIDGAINDNDFKSMVAGNI